MYVPLINVRKPLDIYILISKCLNYCLSIETKNTVCFIPCIADCTIFPDPDVYISVTYFLSILHQLFTFNSVPTNETMYIKEFCYL